MTALVNGVQGRKWYSLMDKVWSLKTLRLAWEKVRANRGAADVDGRRIEPKSPHKLKERIRKKTRRTQGDSLDGSIRSRSRVLLHKQEGRPGFDRTRKDGKHWPNAYFANAGLFALYPAWRAESHP